MHQTPFRGVSGYCLTGGGRLPGVLPPDSLSGSVSRSGGGVLLQGFRWPPLVRLWESCCAPPPLGGPPFSLPPRGRSGLSVCGTPPGLWRRLGFPGRSLGLPLALWAQGGVPVGLPFREPVPALGGGPAGAWSSGRCSSVARPKSVPASLTPPRCSCPPRGPVPLTHPVFACVCHCVCDFVMWCCVRVGLFIWGAPVGVPP